MNVSLTPQLERFVERKVREGDTKLPVRSYARRSACSSIAMSAVPWSLIVSGKTFDWGLTTYARAA